LNRNVPPPPLGPSPLLSQLDPPLPTTGVWLTPWCNLIEIPHGHLLPLPFPPSTCIYSPGRSTSYSSSKSAFFPFFEPLICDTGHCPVYVFPSSFFLRRIALLSFFSLQFSGSLFLFRYELSCLGILAGDRYHPGRRSSARPPHLSVLKLLCFLMGPPPQFLAAGGLILYSKEYKTIFHPSPSFFLFVSRLFPPYCLRDSGSPG